MDARRSPHAGIPYPESAATAFALICGIQKVVLLPPPGNA